MGYIIYYIIANFLIKRNKTGKLIKVSLTADHPLGWHPIKIMYYTYVLKSKVDGFTYIGYTSDLRERVKDHNSGKTRSIKHRIPLELVYYEAYKNKTDARKREIELKKKGYYKEQLFKRIENSLK